MSKRNCNISKKPNAKMWTCEVTDSYGITHVNYFETELEASKWTYYMWENEDNTFIYNLRKNNFFSIRQIFLI